MFKRRLSDFRSPIDIFDITSAHSNFEFVKEIDLENKFGKFYIIPEGGSNSLGVKGCQEILTEIDLDFDYLCCAIGTGCTAAGLIKSMKKRRKLLGFSPFKKK